MGLKVALDAANGYASGELFWDDGDSIGTVSLLWLVNKWPTDSMIKSNIFIHVSISTIFNVFSMRAAYISDTYENGDYYFALYEANAVSFKGYSYVYLADAPPKPMNAK